MPSHRKAGRSARATAAILLIVLAAVTAVSAGAVAKPVPRAGAAGTQILRISARSHMVLRFSTNRLHARPGRVTIVMHNPANAGMKHGIALEGPGVDRDGPIVRPGATSSVTASLRRGVYEYYCPVKGHRAAGMKGTLIVS